MPLGRVRSRSSFTALRQHGRRARSGALRVVFVPVTSTDDADGPRVAFAISRSVGGAVVRNRIRRRLRAACADLRPIPGLYLLTATPAAATCGYAELRADLAKALQALDALERIPA
jgi:ribonuclease P protein component